MTVENFPFPPIKNHPFREFTLVRTRKEIAKVIILEKEEKKWKIDGEYFEFFSRERILSLLITLSNFINDSNFIYI